MNRFLKIIITTIISVLLIAIITGCSLLQVSNENTFNVKVLAKTSFRDPSITNNDALSKTKLIISNRLKALGINKFKIDIDSNNNFIIQMQIPKENDSQQIITFITKTWLLEFRILEGADDEGNPILGPVLITGDKLSGANAGYDNNGQVIVQFSFDSEGAKIFEKITSENIGRQLAIVLDDEIKSAPVIQAVISSDGVIENIGSLEEAKDIALVLQTGALPVNLEVQDVFLK